MMHFMMHANSERLKALFVLFTLDLNAVQTAKFLKGILLMTYESTGHKVTANSS